MKFGLFLKELHVFKNQKNVSGHTTNMDILTLISQDK